MPPKALVSLRLTQVSISLVDLIHMGASCCVRVTPNCAPPQMDSPAQMVAGFVGAVAMGAMFGLIFGLMNVMQDAPGQMERQRGEIVVLIASLGARLLPFYLHIGLDTRSDG